jgi:hypothetical protein
MRVQRARASPENPRIQTVIRADPRKADETINLCQGLLSGKAPGPK